MISTDDSIPIKMVVLFIVLARFDTFIFVVSIGAVQMVKQLRINFVIRN